MYEFANECNAQLNLNCGEFYEIKFCSINHENNFHVNLVAHMNAIGELNDFLNAFCNDKQKKSEQKLKPDVGDILLAKSIIDGCWYRAQVLSVTGSRNWNLTKMN